MGVGEVRVGGGGGGGGGRVFLFWEQEAAYEISEGDWSAEGCSSDLIKKNEREITVLLLR